MSISKSESRKLREAVLSGDSQISTSMSSAANNQDVKLSIVAQKVTVQCSGTLVVAVTVSANGKDFLSAGSATAAAPASYTTHLVGVVRLTWTSGTGQATVLAA